MVRKEVDVCDVCDKRFSIGKCRFCKKDLCHLHARALKVGSRESGMAITFGTSSSVQFIIEKAKINQIFCTSCWKQRKQILSKASKEDENVIIENFLSIVNKYALTKSL